MLIFDFAKIDVKKNKFRNLYVVYRKLGPDPTCEKVN